MLTFFYQDREVRTVGTNEVPEWVARDVAEILGIAQSTLSERLKAMPAEWKGIGLTDTLGGQQQMTTVREAGLYELIFRSDKPEAQWQSEEPPQEQD
jgi:prophage antirepressor-like protein